tara:strand:- start:2482 stop:3057 length:576 start_codon:yes stop_codon:yes gene_type:complete
MRAKKDENGFMSAEQQNHRFINVLQLAYLSADKASGGGYFIPSDVLDKIEMELDFNTTLSKKKDIVEECKKKYRKRKSYLFFKDILSAGNFTNYNKARDILLEIHKKTERFAHSMTHIRYAMESLHLALDDYFGTNKVKVTPNRFLTRNAKCKPKPKPKPKPKKAAKASNRSKKTTKPIPKLIDLDDVVPF